MTREEAIKLIQNLIDQMNENGYAEIDSFHEDALLMAIKALEQEPCEDEYIKVPKKALKYRTAGMVAYNAEWLKNHFDIERAVICGAQEPCDDAISRQAALDAFGLSEKTRKYGGDHSGYDTMMLYEIQNVLESLPPVQPKQKTGKWIRVAGMNERCSACYHYFPLSDFLGRPFEINYCPNCGERMIEPQESEE